MQLTTRLPRRRSARHDRSERPAPKPAPPESQQAKAARRGGGPQDRALYACMCGFAFKAAVTTSVGCPHCGTEQAW